MKPSGRTARSPAADRRRTPRSAAPQPPADAPRAARAKAPEASDSVVSVERAFRLLDFLADRPDGAKLTELSDALGVNKGIGHKLIGTLERLGYVYRDAASSRFFLSYKISNLSLRQLAGSNVLDPCRAVLRALADRTGELARFALAEGDELNWVISVPGDVYRRHALQIASGPLCRISLNAHATGKAWLSTLPFERAWRILVRYGIDRKTTNAIADREGFEKELKAVARRGYATAYQEFEYGVCGVAAPVVVSLAGHEPRCIGVVSVSAPATRLARADLDRLGSLLKEAAAKLAAQLPSTLGLERLDMDRG